jgi:hypothetical protein
MSGVPGPSPILIRFDKVDQRVTQGLGEKLRLGRFNSLRTATKTIAHSANTKNQPFPRDRLFPLDNPQREALWSRHRFRSPRNDLVGPFKNNLADHQWKSNGELRSS